MCALYSSVVDVRLSVGRVASPVSANLVVIPRCTSVGCVVSCELSVLDFRNAMYWSVSTSTY